MKKLSLKQLITTLSATVSAPLGYAPPPENPHEHPFDYPAMLQRQLQLDAKLLIDAAEKLSALPPDSTGIAFAHRVTDHVHTSGAYDPANQYLDIELRCIRPNKDLAPKEETPNPLLPSRGVNLRLSRPKGPADPLRIHMLNLETGSFFGIPATFQGYWQDQTPVSLAGTYLMLFCKTLTRIQFEQPDAFHSAFTHILADDPRIPQAPSPLY